MPLLQKLDQTCSKLMNLEIECSDLNKINVTSFPKYLDSLKLIRCEIPIGWFNKNNFKNLKTIDLTESVRINSTHINCLNTCNHSLEILILKKCYRIDDKAIEVLINGNFESIEYLNLEGD